MEAADRVCKDISNWERRDPNALRVRVDTRENLKPGAKYYEWELRGVPIRMELGPRDLDGNQCVLVRRDTGVKQSVSLDAIGEEIESVLETMQDDMLSAARDRREQNSHRGAVSYEQFRELMAGDGAFVYAGWCDSEKCEAQIKEETKATIRCLPDEEFRSAEAPGRCLLCNADATTEALWAKAY